MSPPIQTTENDHEESISRKLNWDFENMQPKEAFCNWKFKVSNYLPNSSESDQFLVGNKVQITLKSKTNTPFALVSAANRNFNYQIDPTSGKSAVLDLLRFAELETHIVIA